MEPSPEPVDSAELLNELAGASSRHLALCGGAAEAIALWVLFAQAHDAYQNSPRLAFLSPVPRVRQNYRVVDIARTGAARSADEQYHPGGHLSRDREESSDASDR